CRQICEVPDRTDSDNTPWTAAKYLYQSQIDFIYIDAAALKQATIEAGRLSIGLHRFRAVVCDPPLVEAGEVLTRFGAAGGLVLANWQPEALIDALVDGLGRDVDWPG